MPSLASRILLPVVLLLPGSLPARSIDVPLILQQSFLQNQVDNQLFSGDSERLRVWDDGKDCNRLELAEPELQLQNGRVHTRSRAYAQIGTALAGRCLSFLNWQGFVEIEQEPALGIEPGTVRFRVVDSRVYSEDGESPGVLGTVWRWVKKYAHPRFERLRVDINPLLTEIGQLVPLLYPDQPQPVRRILEGVRLTSVSIGGEKLQLTLGLDLPPRFMETLTVDEQAPLTAAELERWQRTWQQWDAFLTNFIKQAGNDAVSREVRTDLLAVLLEARGDLLPVLTKPASDNEPIAELFAATWQRLEPVLRTLSEELPPDSASHYAAFMAAADVLATLQAMEEQTGFSLNADVLRRLARLANPDIAFDPLLYGTEVDPELRDIFGFGPPLPRLSPEPPHARLMHDGDPVIRGAFAGLMLGVMPGTLLTDPHYQSLVKRLNGWVPRIAELNEYLPLVQQLLDRTVGATLNNKGLDRKYRDVFRPLVLATAWQESCWRQFISRNGEILPIRSTAGAVGIMQVNQHVWRGFYEVDDLQNNVGYNAMAGSEIVHHYLVDYAIARAEDRHPGGTDNLVRATYAMYNGGPAHRDRYRRENVSRSLRYIDKAFWNKYQKVRQGDPLVVAECYTG